MAAPMTLGLLLLFTDDFGATCAFCRDHLGWQPTPDDPGAGYRVGVDFQAFATGGPLVEVFAAAVHEAPTPASIGTLVAAFEVDDLRAAADHHVAAGGRRLTEPVERDWGSYLYVQHEAGPPFQLFEAKR